LSSLLRSSDATLTVGNSILCCIVYANRTVNYEFIAAYQLQTNAGRNHLQKIRHNFHMHRLDGDRPTSYNIFKCWQYTCIS